MCITLTLPGPAENPFHLFSEIFLTFLSQHKLEINSPFLRLWSNLSLPLMSPLSFPKLFPNYLAENLYLIYFLFPQVDNTMPYTYLALNECLRTDWITVQINKLTHTGNILVTFSLMCMHRIFLSRCLFIFHPIPCRESSTKIVDKFVKSMLC